MSSISQLKCANKGNLPRTWGLQGQSENRLPQIFYFFAIQNNKDPIKSKVDINKKDPIINEKKEKHGILCEKKNSLNKRAKNVYEKERFIRAKA